MKLYLIFGIYLFTFQACGQNLIPNPRFDEVRDCSISPHKNFFTAWFNPTISKRNRGFHKCLWNLPYQLNSVDHQKYPLRGKGMASILIYYDEETDHRSYIASKLEKRLTKNVPYYISFYVSPKRYESGSRNMVSDAVGIYLTKNKPDRDIQTVLPFNSQIGWHGTYFEDYDRWYRIHGKYVAKGGEDVVVIGNFRSDEHTQYKYNNPAAGSVPNIAELFIDDVRIEAFNPLQDTMLVCESKPVKLNAVFHDARYLWNTGAQDAGITVSQSGSYSVSAEIDSFTFRDTTMVIFTDQLNTQPVDTFFCEKQHLVLRSPLPGQQHWSTGSSNDSVRIQESGEYRLSVQNKCGNFNFIYKVAKHDCNCELVLPTAFSPNDDGQNDIFTVIDQCQYPKWSAMSLTIYDKWGGIVYSNSGPTVSWNGRGINKVEMPPGIYTYRLEGTVQEGSGEESIHKTGSVHLLR